jgi:hypothetical protein
MEPRRVRLAGVPAGRDRQAGVHALSARGGANSVPGHRSNDGDAGAEAVAGPRCAPETQAAIESSDLGRPVPVASAGKALSHLGLPTQVVLRKIAAVRSHETGVSVPPDPLPKFGVEHRVLAMGLLPVSIVAFSDGFRQVRE